MASESGGVTETEIASGTTDNESQCGPEWDVQPVERVDGSLGVSQSWVLQHEGPVGHLLGRCSGTLITPDHLLSAGHCGFGVGDVVLFDYQDDPEGNPRQSSSFEVTQVLEQENSEDWDYAVVELSGSPGLEFGFAVLSDRDPGVGELVAILQHPESEPKGIHTGPVLDFASRLGENWFRHQVDTRGGTSGAGVLDVNGRLVGVHTNAGCITGDDQSGNSAMRLSRLVEHSPALQAVLDPPLKSTSYTVEETVQLAAREDLLAVNEGGNDDFEGDPLQLDVDVEVVANESHLDLELDLVWDATGSDPTVGAYRDVDLAVWEAPDNCSIVELVSFSGERDSISLREHITYGGTESWLLVTFEGDSVIEEVVAGGDLDLMFQNYTDIGVYTRASIFFREITVVLECT